MGTFKELIGKSFLGKLFPEFEWQEFDKNGYDEIFGQLCNPGSLTSATLEYLRKHKVKLGFHSQDYSGGGWTLLRNITITPGTDLNNRYTLSLIIHEVFHLRQSILTRLSVYGELLAWQYQQQGYRQAFGKDIGEPGEAFAGTKDIWDELSRLSSISRDDLAKAQEMMREISPRYRSDCLPLYPLTKELWYFLKQKEFKRGIDAVKNLITCRV